MDPSSIIWDVTKCLCGCLKNQASYVYDLEENLQSLGEKSNKLEVMKKDLEDLVEGEEHTRDMERSHQVTAWLQKVDKIQQEIKDIQGRGAQQIQNKCLSKCPKNCMSSYKLGNNVAKILQNAHELEAEGERLFGKDFKIAHKHPMRPIQLLSEETVGLDFMFDKVWNSIEEKNVGVIGLYGMGGVGKTTLLKKINNELGKRSDFFVMWVVVSKVPNLDNIMDNIRKLVGIDDGIWQRFSNQDEKAARIHEILKEKKFVLLLDDIWERLALERVGVPHPKDTNFQSKVLFTTRHKDVCAKMKAQRKFKVEILTEEEALELFCMKVGEETLKLDPIIPKLATEMARECKGLPLALTVVGSAMSGVESVEAWEHSKNNLMSSSYTTSSLEREVFSILKFSYDKLPDKTHQNCFLYCALYPEDHEIQVYDVIDKWIGEGLLCNDRMRSVPDMRSHGGSIIEKLKLSCLLENVEDDVFLKRAIKMHDVIRDMALWIANDQDRNKKRVIVQEDAWSMSQANSENLKMVERISILKDNGSRISILDLPNLNIILDIRVTKLQNIQYLSRLKVLELHRLSTSTLPDLGGLIFLEYLSLQRVFLDDPLEYSCKLKNLKNLKVLLLSISTGMIALGVISNLPQLKVVKIHSSEYQRNDGEEREFLEELECSSNLEELWVQIETKDGLKKLHESAKLQSCICGIELTNMFTLDMPLLLATMSKIKHLQYLYFFQCFIVIDSSITDICCLSMLRRVNIVHCDSIHHLTWFKYAPLLQEVHVSRCSSLEEVIKGGGSEDQKNRDNVDSIFSSLVELYLHDLPNLRRIHERVLSFPFLRSIEVENCANLKKLPFDSNSAKAKLRRTEGAQEWWDNLEWDDPALKATFQSKFRTRF
ncbi:LOW QUALITY PROTEIN: probable disease resistance protein At1g61300 [Prosopis cineraria]|uniref:LOW QUALITY PROTEIN: probable disease resistance protein At1g61300 n=1 Tax=Prosopis cineraria TaxID=364024 RepID=UPI0024109AA9|nr:LOW QUALITY PROTEIN: probable disease resistance protein At1g61300 [Prosopis cineraria]